MYLCKKIYCQFMNSINQHFQTLGQQRGIAKKKKNLQPNSSASIHLGFRPPKACSTTLGRLDEM